MYQAVKLKKYYQTKYRLYNCLRRFHAVTTYRCNSGKIYW